MGHLTIKSGRGSYLDIGGRSVLDASSGALNVNLGHDHPRIMEAFAHLGQHTPYALRGSFTTEPVETLSSVLTEIYEDQYLPPVYGVTGSDSVEQALRVVMQYWRSKGELNRSFIAADNTSYHGMTKWALDSSGHPPRASGSRGGMISQSQTLFAGSYGSGRRATLQEWKELLYARHSDIGALLYEPVGGASSGAQALSVEDQIELGAEARSLGIPVIADEVMCGLGRLGVHSVAAKRMRADMVVASKGLGAGYYPISILMVRRSFGSQIDSDDSTFGTFGHTMARQAIGATIAKAVIDTMSEEEVWLNVRKLTRPLFDGVVDIVRPNREWSVTGEGFQLGIHCASKDSAILIQKLKDLSFENGVLIHDSGINPSFRSLLVGPPLNSTFDDIGKLHEALQRAFESLKRMR